MRRAAAGPGQEAAGAHRPGSWATLAAYVALVAASHVLWISFASVTGRAAQAFHTTDVSIGLLVPQPVLINAVADLVNRHFPEQEAATATGLGTMAIFLGITLGLVATPGLVAALGVRGCQLVYAAASLAALGAFWRLAPSRVPDRLAAQEELRVRPALARVLRSVTQWKLSAALFLGFGCYLGITAWLEELLRPRGIDEAGAGLVAGMITIAGMAGSVVLGAASDRLRRRKPFLVAAGVAAAPALWLLGRLGSLLPLLAAASLLGFFLLAALPIAIAVASEDRSLGPQVGSTAVGVMLLAGNLGGAVVVAVLGLALRDAGALTAALAVAVALLALTVPDPLRPAGRA